MKRLIALFCIMVLVFGMAACGKNSEDKSSDSYNQVTAEKTSKKKEQSHMSVPRLNGKEITLPMSFTDFREKYGITVDNLIGNEFRDFLDDAFEFLQKNGKFSIVFSNISNAYENGYLVRGGSIGLVYDGDVTSLKYSDYSIPANGFELFMSKLTVVSVNIPLLATGIDEISDLLKRDKKATLDELENVFGPSDFLTKLDEPKQYHGRFKEYDEYCIYYLVNNLEIMFESYAFYEPEGNLNFDFSREGCIQIYSSDYFHLGALV